MLQVMATKMTPLEERRFFSFKRSVPSKVNDLELVCDQVRHICRYDWMLFENVELDRRMKIEFALIGPKGLFLVLVNQEVAVLLSDQTYHVEDEQRIQRVEQRHPVIEAQRLTKHVRSLLKAEGVSIPVHTMIVFKQAPKLRMTRVKFPIGQSFAAIKPWIARRQGTPVTEKDRKQVAFILANHQK